MNQSEIMIERWKNPEFRAMIIEKNKIAHTGKIHTEETRGKIGEKSKERWENPEYRKNFIDKITGKKKKPVSEIGRKNIKEAALKKWADPVYYKRMCKIRKKTFQDPVLIKKLSDAHTGKILSETHRKSISNSLKGKPKPKRSIEHCKNLSKSQKGIPLSNKALNSRSKCWGANNYISKPERLFGATMSKAGIHYTAQFPIRGIPDFFVFPNLCIFVDGNYWHCNPSMYDKPNHSQLKQINSDYWVNKYLRNHGYIVLRFWESDINNRIDWCINRVKTVINTINKVETPKVILLS